MKHHATKVLLIACLVSISAAAYTQESNQESKSQEAAPQVTKDRPMSFWMAQKMELSKQLLEALTKEDFEKIAADAKQLRKLGKIEGIVRRQDPAYRRQHQLFDSALADVVSQAEAKNVEGATLAFHQLTTSCVVCHKMLRQSPDGNARSANVTEPKK